jgi:hypothetical protein
MYDDGFDDSYGYGYGKKSWGSWGSKKTKGSVSGWENSHFGGYNRVLSDYPYIKLDFELDIETGKNISKDLGSWMGDKLIKLYILKVKEMGYIDHLSTEVVERLKYFQIKKYIVAKLAHPGVFDAVCSTYTELAPMFRHYKDGIFESSIEMEIKDEKEGEGKGEGKGEGECEGKGQQKRPGEGEDEGQGEGQGQGDGDGDDESEGDGDGDSDSQPGSGTNRPTKNGKTIQEWMKNISESKPFSSHSSLSNFSEKPKFVSFTERIRTDKPAPYRFKSGEVKDSEALVKLLDIDFDPKSAEVKNLKLGKLDVTKIAEVPAGNMSVYKQIVEEQDTKPFSVCILADMSGSMGNGSRIPSQLHIMNSLYLAMSQILPPDKLYIYGHSGEYTPEIYSFYTPYDPDYERNILYYRQIHWCQNYDGPVIESIHKKIRENTEDRIIFISLSDGEPAGNNYGGKEDNEELKRILERARRDEFVTVGIGIEAGHVSNLYTYAKPVWDLKTLPKDVASIINQVVRAEFK